ncbi:IS110 family transposase [Methanoculleus sp. FWC-SCC1]|uniref:IS110 family transposase n=1 Tax=Methanoculleus frigidifontis TaxID=2584085 RepID=A0ABT8M6V4_9EURY|nr:IS110 family transposase [Methanoculleus sp. FWC-SCC1]MDN7023663.1 IS110 family transposase [Methanoculleus sp. FWC-SCC1]
MREKACGLDLHKKFIVAAVVDQDGTVAEQRFSRTQTDLLLLKDWVSYHGCEVVACESTSDYWVQVYDLFAGQIPVIVGNARDIKALSHKKTDRIDAVWIAKLALHDLIPASRVPDREQRDLRALIRLRKFLVEKRTDLKNQVHHILDSCLFQLAKVFSDIFGASGMVVLTGITEGKPVEEILASLPKRTQKRGEEIRRVLETTLSETAIVRLQTCLALIKEMDSQIAIIMQLVHQCVTGKKRLIRILTSMPGIGYLAAVTLIAEIGDFTDFSSGDKLASWAGLVPTVHQSADHLRMGSITKRGSRTLRWICVEIAHAAVRTRSSRFYAFFTRKVGQLGFGKAIVAVARKILTILWHLVVNDEEYEEQEGNRKREIRIPKAKQPKFLTLNEMLKVLAEANIFLKQSDPHGGG